MMLETKESCYCIFEIILKIECMVESFYILLQNHFDHFVILFVKCPTMTYAYIYQWVFVLQPQCEMKKFHH